MNQLGEQEANILAYTLAVKKLEAQIVTFQKQQLSLIEQLTFQANEIYAKDEKLKRYRRIGMKAVKEKEQLKKICIAEDYINKPLYSRFTKTNSFKGVPHPLTGDYTPKPQEEIDDSLYVYGKKGPQKPKISDSDDNSTEHSTCQSNDSKGSFGNPSEHSSESESESLSVPNEMSTPKSVTANEKVMSESKEVEPSCVTHVKTHRKQMKNQKTHEVKRKNWNEMMERELGEGYSFIKKKCFVCGSLSHLIKDCDYYKKKMAREAEFKKQRVFNTGNGVEKPVWNNINRVNRTNHFIPRPVQLNAVRANVNTGRANINTVRANVNSVRQNVNSVRTNINTVRSKQPVPTNNTNSFSPAHLLKNMEDKILYEVLPSKVSNDHTCVAAQKEFSRGILLATKGEIVAILQKLSRQIENLNFNHRVRIIRSDNRQLELRIGYAEICFSDGNNSAGYSKTLMQELLLSGRQMKDEELIVVPKNNKAFCNNKVGPKEVCLTNFKGREFLTNFQTFLKPREEAMKIGVMFSQPPGFVDPGFILRRFQMSSMGELIFFLGLQVKQKTDGIFISQDKYVADMLKKFDLASVKTAITPMETKMALTKDEEAADVDVHLYRSMIAYDVLANARNFYHSGYPLTIEAKYVAAASCMDKVWDSE
ncbi:putative ribonuclease H-like domain-containing protein [Tanacetum coccineum]